MKLSVISKFLIKKILVNSTGVILILSIILFGNQFIIVARESLKIGILDSELFPYISLKFIRDLTELVSISFLAGLLITFFRMNKDSEKIVLSCSGMSEFKIFKVLLPIIIPFSLIIFVSSVFISPYAKMEINTFKENAKARPDFIFLNENQFQKFGSNIFYSPTIVSNENTQNFKNVFIVSKHKEGKRIILASEGSKFINSETGDVYLYLKNGKFFDKVSPNSAALITEFKSYTLKIFENKIINHKVHNRSEESNILKIIQKWDNLSKGEFFYRISLVIFFISMIFYCINIIQINTRAKKDFSLPKFILVYVAYFNLILYMREIIGSGTLSFLQGFLITHLMFIGIILTKQITQKIFQYS